METIYRTAHLIPTRATILSGGLNGCLTVNDTSCHGGFSEVDAFRRLHCGNESSLVLPWLDTESPFPNMNYYGVENINLLLMREVVDWRVYVTPPFLLNYAVEPDNESLSFFNEMRRVEFPLLMTNLNVPPSNSWYPFTKQVYFDEETKLAVMYIAPDSASEEMRTDNVEAVKANLRTIALINFVLVEGELELPNDPNWETSDYTWITTIVYGADPLKFDDFADALINFAFPPNIIINVNGNSTGVETAEGGDFRIFDVWMVTFDLTKYSYYQINVESSKDYHGEAFVEDVTVVSEDLSMLPAHAKDEQYTFNIEQLRSFVEFAGYPDDVIGYSGVVGPGEECQVGECALGNIFTDAIRAPYARWSHGLSDIAFLSSKRFRGGGWPSGDVRPSFLWESMSPSHYCNGTISGLSLFKLLEYSVAHELLQVSGLKIVYNSELQGSKIVSIQVWNETQQRFAPIQRLQLYSFATDNYLCHVNDPFPALLGGDFFLEGEEPGNSGWWSPTQETTWDWFLARDEAYNTTLEGRLVDDTNATDALGLVQTAADCVATQTFWDQSQLECDFCPTLNNSEFLDDTVHLQGQSRSADTAEATVVLVNNEPYAVKYFPNEATIPGWLEIATESFILNAGASDAIAILAKASTLDEGMARATVVFAVRDGGIHPECIGDDIHIDVLFRATPVPVQRHLGSIRAFGFTAFGLVVCVAGCIAVWVQWNRKVRVVATMQPPFLVAICSGIVIMSSTIVVLGIDDGVCSQRGCDTACMSIPWLLTMGFTITMSALFSKLWRIVKVFGQGQFRRIQVKEKDVIVPFACLVSINLALLLTWTLADPLQWKRFSVPDEEWKTYGTCSSDGSVSKVMLSLLVVVSATALALACHQAWKARNISDEFSEAKNLGVALYSWLQIALVGIPVLFLIERDNPTARYFVMVAVIFAGSLSMLLLIFVPIFLQRKGRKKENVRVSGLEHPTNSKASSAGTGKSSEQYLPRSN